MREHGRKKTRHKPRRKNHESKRDRSKGFSLPERKRRLTNEEEDDE